MEWKIIFNFAAENINISIPAMMNTFKLFNKETSLNAILYILGKYSGSSDLHKVFKTLYFADRSHLVKYGRTITRDVYVKMEFGPVPSNIYDIVKCVRGDSFFANVGARDLSTYFSVNGKTIIMKKPCDDDYLSDSDKECLDMAINLCEHESFKSLTKMSHGMAWEHADYSEPIAFGDMVRECGESEDYARYVEEQILSSCVLL